MSDERNPACKVFIGGLSLNTSKESLKEHFEAYGEIVDAVVMRDATTKRSRGFGFVTYAELKSVDDCLSDKHVVDGREVEAKRAIPREESSQPSTPGTKKVFLGGLSLETAEEDIRAVLESYGPVAEIVIMREKDTERPRGFGFAVFESMDTVENVCQKRYIKIKDRDVEVKKAISQEEMRRTDSRGRPGAQQGAHHNARDHAPSYGAGRDPYTSPYPRHMYGNMVGYDYRYGGGGGAAGDYMRPDTYAYPYPAGYPDRTAAYAYANYGRGGYDMQSAAAAAAYGMYGANGMGGSAYGQSSSTYGPSRSTTYGQMGGAADYGKDRNTSRAYHPYRRAQ